MVLRRCSICDRNFTKRSHTKERPYECSTCKKRFSRSDVLFRHSKLHTQQQGESPGDKSSRQSNASGQLPLPDVTSNMSGDNNGNPLAAYEQRSESKNDAASIFNEADMHHLRRMSMPDGSLNHMQYNMTTPQQTPMAHLATAHTYGGHDYSPIHEFSAGPLSARMPGQVYDPQLVSMDPQMSQNNNMSDSYGPPAVTTNFADQTPDLLQYWLSQADDDFGYAALNFPDTPNGVFNPVNESIPMQPPPPRPQTTSEVSEAVSTSNIPNERFARVEACWKPGTGQTQRFGPSLWEDVLSSPGPNLFISSHQSHPPSLNKSDSRWGIGAELKQRLEMEFGMTSQQQSNSSGHGSFPRPNNLGVPPPEVLDICLDAYFRRFHPLAPFVHVPTFNASSAPLPLLYAMCLLGLSAVKQNVGGNYMKFAFKNILRRCMNDLAVDGTTEASVARRLSTFAAGCLTLNLAALSGDQDQIARAQVLHSTLISNAQKRGLFSVDEVRLDSAFANTMSEGGSGWSGWARLETVKRLTVCLITTDWWFAAYSSISPTIRPEGIQICLPSDNILFAAESYERWEQLMHTGKYKLTFPLIRPRTFHLQGSLDSLICLDPPLHAFGQYALLSVLKLCQRDTQHRHYNTFDAWDENDQLIPWRAFNDDMRGRTLVPVIVGLASIVTATPKTTDLNALLLWHNLCMTMNANAQVFELAAGRNGAAPASKALADITEWTQSPSARRAVLHAAQAFKLLNNRKVSDPISMSALTGLFYAALVLGLYLFTVRDEPDESAARKPLPFDVLDDIDWILVGDAGMTEDMTPGNSPGTVFETSNSSVPAVAFIEHGGRISIGGADTAGGYMSARRTFLDFAQLMDEMGTWKPKALSKILHIMSDVLEEGM